MTGEVILTVESGSLAGKSYVFNDRQVCVLGRADDCDIWIPGKPENLDVSRHHCVLDIDPPQLTVRDLGSLNGTWVNGQQVGWLAGEQGKPWNGGLFGESRPLCVGDELRVGHTVFRVRSGVPQGCSPLPVEDSSHEDKDEAPADEGPKKPRAKAGFAAALPRDVDLDAWTAVDLMTPRVITASAGISLAEATAILMANRVSAVLMTDDNGQPAGVLSQTDLLAHDCKERGKVTSLHATAGPKGSAEPDTQAPPALKETAARAADIMTPLIFSVPADASGSTVVTTLLSLQVHRLFVTNKAGRYIGVISRTDVLRRLYCSSPRRSASCRCEVADPVLS